MHLNWYKTKLLQGFFALVIFLASYSVFAVDFTVTSSLDSGLGTFRDAITQYNTAVVPPDNILFNVNVVTINTPLPPLQRARALTINTTDHAPVTLDGSSAVPLLFLYRAGTNITLNNFILFQGISNGGNGGTGGNGGGGGLGAGAALFLNSGTSATLVNVQVTNNRSFGGNEGAGGLATGGGGGGGLFGTFLAGSKGGNSRTNAGNVSGGGGGGALQAAGGDITVAGGVGDPGRINPTGLPGGDGGSNAGTGGAFGGGGGAGQNVANSNSGGGGGDGGVNGGLAPAAGGNGGFGGGGGGGSIGGGAGGNGGFGGGGGGGGQGGGVGASGYATVVTGGIGGTAGGNGQAGGAAGGAIFVAQGAILIVRSNDNTNLNNFTGSAVTVGAGVGAQALGQDLFLHTAAETATFDVTAPSTQSVTMNGSIAGAGGVSKLNSGTLIFANPTQSSYTNGTIISGGTLRTSAPNNLPPGIVTNSGSNNGAVSVAAGATFDLFNNNQTIGDLSGAGSITLGAGTLTFGTATPNTTFSGVISGTGGLTKQGTGRMLLSGNNTYTGTTIINRGTLAVSGTLLSNMIQVTGIGGIATLEYNGGTITGPVTGNALSAVTVTANSASQNTITNISNITINPGVTFSVFPVVFPVLSSISGTTNIINNGTLIAPATLALPLQPTPPAPHLAPVTGLINITGSYSQPAGATFNPFLSDATHYGRIIATVGGLVAPNSFVQLSLVNNGVNINTGDTFNLIESIAVGSNPTLLQPTLPTLRFVNDPATPGQTFYQVVAIRTPFPAAVANTKPCLVNIATAIEAIRTAGIPASMFNLFVTLTGLSLSDLEFALAELEPVDLNGGSVMASYKIPDMVQRKIRKHFDEARYGYDYTINAFADPYGYNPAGSHSLGRKASGYNAGDCGGNNCCDPSCGDCFGGDFSYGPILFGDTGKQNNTSCHFGYNYTTLGVGILADTSVYSFARLGVGLTYANTTVNTNIIGNRITVNNYQGYVFGRAEYRWLFLDALYYFGVNNYQSKRNITFLHEVAGAKYRGIQFGTLFCAGIDIPICTVFITPQVRLQTHRLDQWAYTENGAPDADLTVAGRKVTIVEAQAGVKFTEASEESFIPELHFMLIRTVNNPNQNIVSQFVVAGPSFIAPGATFPKFGTEIGLSITASVGQNAYLQVGYDYEARNGIQFQEHSAYVKVRWDF